MYGVDISSRRHAPVNTGREIPPKRLVAWARGEVNARQKLTGGVHPGAVALSEHPALSDLYAVYHVTHRDGLYLEAFAQSVKQALEEHPELHDIFQDMSSALDAISVGIALLLEQGHRPLELAYSIGSFQIALAAHLPPEHVQSFWGEYLRVIIAAGADDWQKEECLSSALASTSKPGISQKQSAVISLAPADLGMIMRSAVSDITSAHARQQLIENVIGRLKSYNSLPEYTPADYETLRQTALGQDKGSRPILQADDPIMKGQDLAQLIETKLTALLAKTRKIWDPADRGTAIIVAIGNLLVEPEALCRILKPIADTYTNSDDRAQFVAAIASHINSLEDKARVICLCSPYDQIPTQLDTEGTNVWRAERALGDYLIAATAELEPISREQVLKLLIEMPELSTLTETTKRVNEFLEAGKEELDYPLDQLLNRAPLA